MQDGISETANENAGQLGVGSALRQARESLGLSLEDVANRLKFAPNQIEALEDEDFAHLPEIAFVRGFVRSYARLLQLDEESLLAKLPNPRAQEAQERQAAIIEEPFPNLDALRKSNVVWLGGALVVVLAIVLFVWVSGEKQPEPKVETANLPLAVPASAVAETAPVTPAPVEEHVEQAPEKPVVAPVPAAPVTKPAPAAPVTKPAPAAPQPAVRPAKPAAPATPQHVASPSVEAPVTAASGVAAGLTHKPSARSTLRMVFDEDSWVEVKDKNGVVLMSQLGLRGSERGLNREPPFVVTIGHAHGVRLFFKGQQVDLEPYTHIDVAHVTLE